MKQYSFGLLVGFLPVICLSIGFSCKDQNNNDVDWYVAYKLPDINGHSNRLVQWGVGFLYMDENSGSDWEMSRASINASNQAIAQTLQQIYDHKMKDDNYHIMYNDDHPSNKTDSYRGHTKGVQLFDSQQGFWLIHSVPRFPPMDKYSYPQSGTVFGQSVLCITFNTKQSIENIAQQLLYNQPSLYSSQLPAAMAQLYPTLAQVVAKKSVRKEPFNRMTTLSSKGGKKLTSFAKHRRWGKDLYSDFVAQDLKSDILVETWLNGKGDLPSICNLTYKTHNLREVKPDQIQFTNSKDHSKWAASETANEAWICIGDINRQKSQYQRGGGTMCFQDERVWRAYRTAVARVECCNTGWELDPPPPKNNKDTYKEPCRKTSSAGSKKSVITGIFAGLFQKLYDFGLL